MPITVNTFESSYILHYRFTGRLTLDDFKATAEAEEPFFDALGDDECLNIIADFTDLETISPALFPEVQQMRIFSDDRVCWVVVVGANPYLRALAISLGLFTQQRRFTFRNSYDEGLRVLGISGNGHHKPSGKAT